MDPFSGQATETVMRSAYVRPRLRGSVTKRTIYKRDRVRNIARQEAKRCMQRLAEQKHNTTGVTHAPCPSAGAIDSLSILSQGTSATTRIGQQTHQTLLTIYGIVNLPAATASDSVRIAVGVDHEAVGSNPGVTDVLESASINSPFNHDKVSMMGARSRMRIIGEKLIPVNGTSATVTTIVIPFKLKFKLDFVTFYQSNAGTISDVLKDNLFVLVISDNANATVSYQAQVCYTDL